MKPFWTTPKKIAFTVALAVICWMLFGCGEQKDYSTGTVRVEESLPGALTESFLRKSFKEYNEAYFQGKLPTPQITLTTLASGNMAETSCADDGSDCSIWFDYRMVPVQRTGEAVLVHEMCHMKVWTRNLEVNRPPMMSAHQYNHGRVWQSCMLQLDAMGAFREINIDYYRER